VYGQDLPLAVIYLREEPDALMSARPALCGGHQATGVPTATFNFRSLNLSPLALEAFDRLERTRPDTKGLPAPS
jgi:hypothetical protein